MNDEPIQISQRAFEALVRQLGRGSGSNPNPDDPDPPGPLGPLGPLGPVIRSVNEWLRYIREPDPEPWHVLSHALLSAFLASPAARGPNPHSWFYSELNPQPLPPRMLLVAVLTQEVIERTTLLFELADALPEDARRRALDGASSELGRFVSDVDGDLCPVWRRWPRPPRKDLTQRFDRSEVIVVASQLEAASRLARHERLREEFAGAAASLMRGGVVSSPQFEDASLT